MSDKIKQYTNGDLTIVWNPELCHHAAECVKGLPQVFNPQSRPWIQADGCSTMDLKETIQKCPSGALTYIEKENTNESNPTTMSELKEEVNCTRAQVIPNGPIIIHCNLDVEKPDGSTEKRENKASFCRCGASENKPFCDGTHKRIGWEG